MGSVTVRDADVEYSFDDPDEGWFGMVRPVEAAPSAPAVEPTGSHRVAEDGYAYAEDPARSDPHVALPPGEPDVGYPQPELREPEALEENTDTDRWSVHDIATAAAVDAASDRDPAPDDRPRAYRPESESIAAALSFAPPGRSAVAAVSTPSTPSWESRLSNSGAWDFKATSDGAWYRSKVVLLAGAALVLGAAVVGIVLALTGPSTDQAPAVAPSTPSAPPTPATSVPVLSSEAPPPPAPPPPPPPSAEEVSPPVVTRQYAPSYQTPDEPKKPQTNVTRSPLSATPPVPPQQTDKGRATPGESGHHGFFG